MVTVAFKCSELAITAIMNDWKSRIDARVFRPQKDRMSTKTILVEKLTAAFSPLSLDVVDESDHHKGHGGWREGGETHFRIRIVAETFSGMSRVGRHRAINDLLAQELADGVHALAIEARSPEEPDPRQARATVSP